MYGKQGIGSLNQLISIPNEGISLLNVGFSALKMRDPIALDISIRRVTNQQLMLSYNRQLSYVIVGLWLWSPVGDAQPARGPKRRHGLNIEWVFIL
jgi:hypothetical protein